MSVAVKLPDTGGSGWPTKTKEECAKVLFVSEQTPAGYYFCQKSIQNIPHLISFESIEYHENGEIESETPLGIMKSEK